MKNLIAFLTLLFFCSCGQKERTFKELPTGPIKHQLIVLAKSHHGVRARGFLGATPSNTEVSLKVGAVKDTVRSLADGSFNLELKSTDPNIDHGQFAFRIGEKVFEQTYSIKIIDAAHSDSQHPSDLREIAKAPFNTDGREVSALDFYDQQVAILSSEASLVRFFNVDTRWIIDEKPSSSMLLFQEDAVALGARMITNVGKFFVTPLFNAHAVALIGADTHGFIAAERLKDSAGQLSRFLVNPPLQVSDPIDADDSNLKTNTIARTTAQNAEAVMALDNTHFLVSFANYYQAADFATNSSAVVGPGIVALMVIDGDHIKAKTKLVLPFKNPTFFLKKDNKNVWVACAGSWQANDNGIFTSVGVGLVRLLMPENFSSLAIEHQIPLNDFAITEPAIVGTKLILPHAWQNEIAVIDEKALVIAATDRKRPDNHRDVKFTFAAPWHGDIVFLGDAHGTLIAYSLSEGFFPFPFVEPILLDQDIDQKVMVNPIHFWFRHKVKKTELQDNYPTGYNAWVLTATYKIYPLDFLSVFGP